MTDATFGLLLAGAWAGAGLVWAPLAARGLPVPAALWCWGGPVILAWSLNQIVPTEQEAALAAVQLTLRGSMAAALVGSLFAGFAAFWLGRGRTLLNRAGLVAPPALAIGAFSSLIAMMANPGTPLASFVPPALGLPVLAIAGALAGMRRQPGAGDPLAAPLTELRVGIAGLMLSFGLLCVASLWTGSELRQLAGGALQGDPALATQLGTDMPRWKVMMPAAPALLFSVILAATQLVPLGEALKVGWQAASAGLVALLSMVGVLATVGFVVVTLL